MTDSLMECHLTCNLTLKYILIPLPLLDAFNAPCISIKITRDPYVCALFNPCTALMRTALPSLTYILTLLPSQQEPCSSSEWAGLLFQQNSFICKDSYSATLTDSGALMKTLDFPSWYWSGSMLTD